jgi:hypothetical protein
MKKISVWFPTKYEWVVVVGGGEFLDGRCGAMPCHYHLSIAMRSVRMQCKMGGW